MTTSSTLKIAIAQLDPIVGDIAGNVAKAKRAYAEAKSLGADLVVYSELFLAGYSPEDLVRKPAFASAVRRATEALAGELKPGEPHAGTRGGHSQTVIRHRQTKHHRAREGYGVV